MTAEIKLTALILAGLLSCQAAALPPAAEEPPAETAAATEPRELLEEMVIYEHWLPKECAQPVPAPEQGLVLRDQVPGHEEFPHTFTMYLPPHYSDEEQYDLLIFLGPSDGEPGDCINVTWDTWYTDYFKFADIFDQLILQKRVRPFLLVQPDYLQWQDLQINYDTVSLSIKEELLPYLAENYATYAEDGSYEALVGARDHIAMGGCSLGGMYTFRGLMRHCSDVSSAFCPMSCNIDLTKSRDDTVALAEKYPIRKLVYSAGGIEEVRMKQMPDLVRNMLPEILTDENFVVLQSRDTHHHYSTWATGLWNSLQYLFRPEA